MIVILTTFWQASILFPIKCLRLSTQWVKDRQSYVVICRIKSIDEKIDSTQMRDEIETLEALQALGYSTREAREAMKNIGKNTTGAKDRLKEALKILGRQE